MAIVKAQSGSHRLRPIVLILLNSDKKSCASGRYNNLEKTTHSEDGSKLDIVKNLEPDAYGLDLSVVKLT